MKIAEIDGALLDYWVAQAKGDTHVKLRDDMWFRPSSDWKQGGPIIEREDICLDRKDGQRFAWMRGD